MSIVQCPGANTHQPEFAHSAHSQPNHVDEPIEPAKLFRVERIKPTKGNPFWEQRILKQFGIADERGPRVTILKNIPETNAMLWKVKHLVHIVPIRFPFGEPNATDVAYTHLKESGECVVTKAIAIDERRLEAAVEFGQRPDRLDGETLRKDSRLKWLNHW